jgi:hypothetical protein
MCKKGQIPNRLDPNYFLGVNDFLTKMVHVKSSVMIGHFSKELLYPKFQIQI